MEELVGQHASVLDVVDLRGLAGPEGGRLEGDAFRVGRTGRVALESVNLDDGVAARIDDGRERRREGAGGKDLQGFDPASDQELCIAGLQAVPGKLRAIVRSAEDVVEG
ncbi:MAG TPA: hypothetical protein VNA04_10840, partial [Thermoanaerobaculia bacterium]|nr:hypothetical protein [Thermoanaerobaculia bacterium]